MIPLEINLSMLLGLILLFGSIVLIMWSAKELKNNDTTILPDGEPEKIVITGPFKYTRNPIYLGMTGILFATAMLMQSLSALLMPVLFLLIIENTWIPHEESKLEKKFEDDWKSYANSTRRWLW
tara:strand:+ start:354 stop:725 length:372 start_codon:yes stop_codon:yes gene_type:complete